ERGDGPMPAVLRPAMQARRAPIPPRGKNVWKLQFFIDNSRPKRCSGAVQVLLPMKKEKRGGAPFAGITVAAILLASTAGYVSALSRMFEAPLVYDSEESDFLFDEALAPRAPEAPVVVNVEQTLPQTAPEWLMN